MATLVSPVAFPDESQLRQASLITLIVVIVACAVVLIAIIGGLMCLFFCYRQKRIFVTKKTKAMRKEVAESVRQTSREVTAVQKYLRTSSKPQAVSLAALSSSRGAVTPPAPRRQAAEPDAQPEEIALENTTIDEADQADDRPLPPEYKYPMEEIVDDSFQKKRHEKRPSPPTYTYPAYALD